MYTPVSLQELDNARQDVKSLEKVINGNENEDVVTRLGETYPTINKAVKQLFENGGLPATPFETKAQMIASSKADGAYAVVTNDAIANIGVYLKKSGAWTLVPWNNFGALNSLTINSGKVYPFKTLARSGQTTETQPLWNNAILDVVVTNAKPDNYYRLSYYANGNTAFIDDGSGWQVRRYTKAQWNNFSDNGTEIVAIRTHQTQLATTGIDTISLKIDKGETITITVDTSKLPAKGTFINGISSASKGYTDIIDPSRYIYALPEGEAAPIPQDSITINSGKVYPLKVKTRNGITTLPNDNFTNALLDVKVINAKKDCYYNIGYYTNGDTALNATGEGWRIERFLISDYTTNDTKTVLVNYTENQRALTSGIDTLAINTTNGETFVITIDTSKLPTRGTPIRALTTTQTGYSSIVDPSCYIYSASGGSVTPSSGGMLATLESGVLSVVYPSGTGFYRLNFAPNGYNTLPNIVGFDYSTDGSEWGSINKANTDWLPPLAIVADTGDGGSFIYTGGNHGADGGSGGGKTARNIYYDIKFNGVSKTAFNGATNTVEINIVNELFASNTITLNRYAVRQAFKVLIENGVITVTCQVTALEPLQVKTDNGVQSVTQGFNDSYLMLNSQYQTRRAWDAFTSGTKALYPNAWAVITQSTAGHQLTSWMDASYGAGDRRYVADSSEIIRRNESTGSTKVYHCVIKGVNAVMAKGDNYKWRGGYHAKAAVEKPVGADSQFDALQRVIAYSATDYMTV